VSTVSALLYPIYQAVIVRPTDSQGTQQRARFVAIFWIEALKAKRLREVNGSTVVPQRCIFHIHKRILICRQQSYAWPGHA
jgi:hypothetical protein